MKRIISIINYLNDEIYGLERAIINRNIVAKDLGYKSIVYVISNCPQSREQEYYDQFGEVIWLNLGNYSLERIDKELRIIAKNNFTKDDLIIHDDFSNKLLKFSSIMFHLNMNYWISIHYDPFINSNYSNLLDKRFKYLVASEWLKNKLNRLGFFAEFLQPSYFNSSIKILTENKNRKHLFVGNNGPIKNGSLVIEAFKDLPQEQLDIYGRLPLGLSEKDLPSNISFKGFFENIPYHNYYGIISSSYSECFANNIIESCNHVNRIYLMEAPYSLFLKKINSDVLLYKTKEDLIEMIKKDNKEEIRNFNKLANRYSYNEMKDTYKKLITTI